MSIAEVLHRVANKLQSTKEQRLGTGAEIVPEPNLVASAFWIQVESVNNRQQWVQAADKVCRGELDVFNLDDYSLGVPPVWNKDPKTGTHAPLEFGKTLNYRDESIVGDIKYLWEPSRHLQLVSLCMAYKLTGDDRYYEAFRFQLDSWFEQCPYLMGAQWVSSLELGIRLLNWSICWQLLGGLSDDSFAADEDQAFKQRWLESIYQHSHFINGHYSRFSSANNHLIGEASGVFVASTTWPYWPEMNRWGTKARGILETESINQTFADGVNKEQAISYQQFVLDFLLLPYLAAKAAGQPFSSQYQRVMESMMEYLAAMIDVAGNIPMIGDADDGYAVKLDYSDGFCPYRSLLATGAALFNRPDFKLKVAEFDDKSLILNGSIGASAFEAVNAASPEKLQSSFKEGGYHILGSNLNQPNEIKLIIDTGPLGYGGIAAHGHADALSVYLAVAGTEILVDPGTYAYHTEQKWRDYFRGTSAHNTVRIDGIDQSVIGGNFMWLDKAEAELEDFKTLGDTTSLLASHNGYMRLSDPLLHQREVIFHKNSGVFELSDRLKCQAEHQVEQFWHFAEDCRVEVEAGNRLRVTRGDVIVVMVLDGDLAISVSHGDADKPSGWVSRSFDNKTASITVCASGTISAEAVLTTRIEIETSKNIR